MNNTIKMINFTDLTHSEKYKVLEWRNHPEIKQWMYTQEDISLENHLQFIESLKDTNDKLYFLVKKDNDYLGVVDFYNIDYEKQVCEFGLYANPNSKVPGVGRLLEKVCIDFVFDTLRLKKLKLEVFSNNLQVRNLHKKFNFKEIDKKTVNQTEVICMELINEDR